MLRVIEDAETIKNCQAQLEVRVRAVTTEERLYTVGFPGGTAEAIVFYSEPLDFWMTLKPIDNRYWNCGGIGNPFSVSSPAPHVEINPPLAGINRRIAGAYLEDEDGVQYIGHNGKVGGGAKGVAKANFLVYYPGWTWVWSGDRQIPMYVIGQLDDPRLPRKLRDFTRASADFRKLVKAGKIRGVGGEDGVENGLQEGLKKGFGEGFSPEFEGTRTYTTAEQVEAVCVHGSVVRALHAHLAAHGLEAFNTGSLDLLVPGDDGSMALLFEVKSDADTTSIYGAVGQLMFHGAAGAAKRLVAVLPEDVMASRVQRLGELGIEVVTFTLDQEDGSVAFDGIDALIGDGDSGTS